MMELGFDTIGNATLIAYDRGPILATDPWIRGAAYFGSWNFSHEIPREQQDAILKSKYIWFSHGHPDHLNADSLLALTKSQILVPDHAGNRIVSDLQSQGFEVRVLPDRQWVNLSDRIRVFCIADYNQDAVLLVDLGGTHLLANLNDAADRGWLNLVNGIVRAYPRSFLLAYAGWGDADMMNFFAEDGTKLLPDAAQKPPVGEMIAKRTAEVGANAFVPFSSMHRYQRADSVWANEYIPALSDYETGFASGAARLLPAYIRYDCISDSFVELKPKRVTEEIVKPEAFGDNWDDLLDKEDVTTLEAYVKSVEYLARTLQFVNFRVGSKDYTIDLNPRAGRGITFAVPRQSLMTAVRYEVFDDLLIGNFMKTTLHGKWPLTKLYPGFTPFLAKYADNGRAKSLEELETYFETYRRRAPVEYVRHRIAVKCEDAFRSFLPAESGVYKVARSIYRTVKSVSLPAVRYSA
ncbi:MAG: MBL fold metallo-hydrolase [Bryobacteraceae bacterium]